MKFFSIVLLAFLSLTFYGCAGTTAFNRTENYANAWPAIRHSTHSKIAIIVKDERPYVQDGSKNETFVGLMRGGYGNPFDITTESKLPLADDIANAVRAGFLNSGINAYLLGPFQEAKKSKDKSERLLVLKIREWKSDTYTNTKFSYIIQAEIFDEQGKLTGSSSVGETLPVSSAVESGRQALTTLLSAEPIKNGL